MLLMSMTDVVEQMVQAKCEEHSKRDRETLQRRILKVQGSSRATALVLKSLIRRLPLLRPRLLREELDHRTADDAAGRSVLCSARIATTAHAMPSTAPAPTSLGQ
jgi:hypothetical protein